MSQHVCLILLESQATGVYAQFSKLNHTEEYKNESVSLLPTLTPSVFLLPRHTLLLEAGCVCFPVCVQVYDDTAIWAFLSIHGLDALHGCGFFPLRS